VKILFDETQKERGRIYSNFSILENDLQDLGYQIAVLDTFPIKYSSINSADVLVFLCPDGSKLYGHEIKNILRFVNEGGILCIFGNAGGDKGLNTNLNSLLKHFEIELVPNQIFDFQNFDFQMESCPIVTKLYPHPITEDVKSLSYCSGCSLHIGKEVIEIARTQNSSDPPSSTVIAVTQYGDGWVFVSGSYLMFSNKKVGIMNRDNRQLLKNLFKWAECVSAKKAKPSPKEIVKEMPTIVNQSVSPQKENMKMKEIPEEPIEPVLIKPSELTDDEIAKVLLQIKQIEKEIERFDVDPSYKEIIITDIARKRGIDYAMVQRYLTQRREEKTKEVESKQAQQVVVKKEKASGIKPQPPTKPVQEFKEKKVAMMIPNLHVNEQKPIVQEKESYLQKQETEQAYANMDIREDILVLTKELKDIKKSIDELNKNIVGLFDKLLNEIQKGKDKDT